MKKAFSRVFNAPIARAVQIFALLEVIAVIFNTSMPLPTDLLVSEAHAQAVPEMPFVMIPVFIAMTAVSVLYLRRNMMQANAA